MSVIYPGRYAAQLDGSFVVFIIGMRVNKLWAVHKWLPVARAMGPMLELLFTHKDQGMLYAETFLYWRGVALIQYWRSFEQLERFARAPELPHLEPWKRFNRAVGADGSVGIWHETYLVAAGQYESVYGNMPRFGLASAGEHIVASGKRETARRRLGGEGEPAVPSYHTPGKDKP
jgi:Domain of unknown function (DUF4188)